MHVPWILLVMNSGVHEALLVKHQWKVGITERKGSSLLLEFGFRPHSSKGLSWQCWCSGSLAYMAVTPGLFVLPLLSMMISM